MSDVRPAFTRSRGGGQREVLRRGHHRASRPAGQARRRGTERFARRWPRYRDRFLAATLAQGAALHPLNGSTGVKDLDMVLLYAAVPGERFPEFPRLVKHVDFGPSSLGRQAYELAAARDDRQRRQWARWAD